jgi:hypothetical protein
MESSAMKFPMDVLNYWPIISGMRLYITIQSHLINRYSALKAKWSILTCHNLDFLASVKLGPPSSESKSKPSKKPAWSNPKQSRYSAETFIGFHHTTRLSSPGKGNIFLLYT